MLNVRINGKDIKEARIKAGMSRQDLSFKLRELGIGCGISTIQAWEGETRTPEAIVNLFSMAKVLGIEIPVVVDSAYQPE